MNKSLAIVSGNDNNNNRSSKHVKCSNDQEQTNDHNEENETITKKLVNGRDKSLITTSQISNDSDEFTLLKIKDKLEYHLISLKNILSLMSNCADHITQKYLDDIQCENRFEKQNNSCNQTATIRHYYTSN